MILAEVYIELMLQPLTLKMCGPLGDKGEGTVVLY